MCRLYYIINNYPVILYILYILYIYYIYIIYILYILYIILYINIHKKIFKSTRFYTGSYYFREKTTLVFQINFVPLIFQIFGKYLHEHFSATYKTFKTRQCGFYTKLISALSIFSYICYIGRIYLQTFPTLVF